MCGIAAILSSLGGRIPRKEDLQRMNDAMAHRGPDGEGIQLFTGARHAVGLGHRRLSIIDLAGGKQPMCNEDCSVWITYNGEIYNYLELQKELQALGHRFRTRCDTETIVHAYEEWGAGCVERLRGMFAFAIWDARTECCFAARDRLGVKPFYYVESAGALLCASEVKALLAAEWISASLRREAVPEYLTLGYLAGDGTLFQGINKLLPGHWLLWREGKLQIERYWDVPLPAVGNESRSEGELTEEFLALFRDSVRMRLMSDVPLGVFLSGGLDSSAIAAVMAGQMSAPVKTFSVGFEADYYSEFDFAREAAAEIGAEHHEIVLKPNDAFASLPRLIWHEDEPIRNSSSVALYEVSRLAGEHVKVVLTGEGSDETFAGYERYWATLFNMKWGGLYHRMVPDRLHRSCVRGTLWKWPLPLAIKKKLSHTFLNYSLRPEEIVYDNFYAIFSPEVHRQLFAAEFWDGCREENPYRDTMELYRRRDSGLLDRLLYADQKTYLVELLMKQDNMSMAASIESRVPFLDHKLVEFAARVPARFKLRGCNGKYLVKQAMKNIVPKSIIARKKMGFPVPLNQWFRRGFDRVVRSVLLGAEARDRGIFNESYVAQLLGEHLQGKRDRSEALWTLLNFELWARIFLDREGWPAIADRLAEAANLQPERNSAAVA
ncbi:MAG: asparagine synthase (glutamine-hydrolyzing) [Pirellulales bacterium]|nr:asparagine synthase (glutamine-hydrolyzing) [Pirellulales bacterium]